MGFLASLLPGDRPHVKPLPGEVSGVVGAWYGARTSAGLSIAGGAVVLGADYLVFSPWDMDRTRAWLVQWLKRAGVSHVGNVDKLLTASKLLEPVTISLAEIKSVAATSEGSLLRPSQARLTLRSGQHRDFGILASPHPSTSAARTALRWTSS